METNTKLSFDKKDASLLILVEGELDFSSQLPTTNLLEDISKARKVTIDLEKCDAIDSSGLGFLLVLRNKLKSVNIIRIQGASEKIGNKLKLCHFHELFNIS